MCPPSLPKPPQGPVPKGPQGPRKDTMSDTIKKCRCGRRIPGEWRVCAQCRIMEDQDRLEDGLTHRLEIAQLVRVRRSMAFDVTPVLDPEEQQALLNGIARISQQEHILSIRAALKVRQHISVLYSNARAYSMDMDEMEYDD